MTRISRFGFVNAYLVSEDDGLTLVDTLVPRSAKVVLRAADELGAPIVRIALTHAHGDHIGSLDELAAALPGVEVLISARDARLLRQGHVARPRRAAAQAARQLPGGQDAADADPRRRRHGRLARSRRRARAHARATSRSSTAATGRCSCGDTYTTLGGVATTNKVRLPFPLASMATWDPATELESARALRALEPAALAPGHGQGRRRAGGRHGRRDRQGVGVADAARGARHRPRGRRGGADRRRRGPRRRHPGAGGRRAGRPAPSLYNHVEATAGCCARLAVRGVRELTAALRDAAVGRSGADALAATARAYRAYAHAHPGLYAASVRGAGAGRRRAPGGRAGDGRRRLRRAARLEPRGRRRGPRRARVPQRGPRLRGAGGRAAASGSRSTSTSPSSASWRRWPAGSRYRSMTARSARRRISASATSRR